MAGETQGMACLQELRQYHESDKQWAAREQFLQRHLHLYPGRKLDQLIAMSVVWANIVFMGNRYGEHLTQKVHQMAEGIDVGEMPSFELVPGAKTSKRPGASDGGELPAKKVAKFGPRPRFQPVHFVVSTVEDDNKFQPTKNKQDVPFQLQDNVSNRSCDLPSSSTSNAETQQRQPAFYTDDVCVAEEDCKMEQNSLPVIYDSSNVEEEQNSYEPGTFMSKIQQSYTAKFKSHHSTMSKDFRDNVLDTWKDTSRKRSFGVTRSTHPPVNFQTGKEASKYALQTREKTFFFQHVSSIVRQNMEDPTVNMDDKQLNYTSMLTRSIQSCKANPEYIYVNLKDISPGDLPENNKLLSDGYACEVRCQDVYIATGYSGSKNGARDKAAKNAIHLLQRSVEVLMVERKFRHSYLEDLVVWPTNTPFQEFPPVLKRQDAAEVSHFDPARRGTSSKAWSDFILTENASDAIGILNNSATFNKMTVDYKYEMAHSNMWRCSVFVQGHFLADGFGNKKSSKHAAAEAAVHILKNQQSNVQKTNYPKPPDRSKAGGLQDIMIYENINNPVCTLNDTAQFNKVTVEYVFEKVNGLNWKCKVFMEQQFLAEAIGPKKTVKHIAAEEALSALKKTQPVLINNIKNGPVQDAISRQQIRGWSRNEDFKKQIKEDNIGNQLLRKMGWTGGGLGKTGEGIAEPISVTEQFRREGLGLVTNKQKINKRDLERIIMVYATSINQDDLTFSKGLSNEERKVIHQLSLKYGLKSRSHGQGEERFLVVSRKRNKQDILHQLRTQGQVGSLELVLPQQS